MNIHVVIPAGGSGSRFGAKERKQFIMINGEPMLNRVVRSFHEMPFVSQIIVPLPFEEFSRLTDEEFPLPQTGKINYVMGGFTRAVSVYQGFSHLRKCQPNDVVLIHDAARPVICHDLIQRIIDATKDKGAAIPGLPVTDTIKKVDQEEWVTQTIDRSSLRAVQTPQGFKYGLLEKAYNTINFRDEKYTDESMLIEAIGEKVVVVQGDKDNIKVTTPDDLPVVEEILKKKRSQLMSLRGA